MPIWSQCTKIHRRINSIFSFALILWLLPACALVNPKPPENRPMMPADSREAGGQSYWWYVKVKIPWPEDEPIAWHMDVLLARLVFKPVLIEHAQDIEMWRFHRRAVRDRTGHQFSFIFYAGQLTAAAIEKKIAQDPLVHALIAWKKVETVLMYDANKGQKPTIEATSDKNWSLPVQKAWPYFAMGVSQAWLSLIDQQVASLPDNGENAENIDHIPELIALYRRINNKLAATWENEGGHAFLHHLNALFGYGDVAIYERRLMRF